MNDSLYKYRYTVGMAKHTRENYLAGEIGTIRKDPGGKMRVALLYPNRYEVGMSNLGFQTLYRLFNARDDVVCERAFLPEVIRPQTVLRTLESDYRLSEMDVVAFSVSFELDYVNIPRMLCLGGIEPFASERRHPLVLAGGATLSYNPEPIAPFLDIAVIGEAEDVVNPLVDALHGASETEVHDALAMLPGVYLPTDGASPTPRLAVRNLNATPIYNQIFTEHTEFGGMALVEIARGCPHACSFCIASHAYRPARWRDTEALLPAIERGLQYRKRVGLIGASVTDHPQIVPLCEEILRRGGQPSPASMRADMLTDELLTLLAAGGVQTITLAPETGRESLRRQVGKTLSDDALFAAAQRARRAGISQMKLYFIAGLPGETEEDVAAIPALALRLAKESGMKVSVGCSIFIPKPGTPFARKPMITQRDARRKLDSINKSLHGQLEFTAERTRWSYWQAVLARGGRELAPALAVIAESPDTPSSWDAAFRAHNLEADRYALDAIPADAPLPWAHIGQRGYELG